MRTIGPLSFKAEQCSVIGLVFMNEKIKNFVDVVIAERATTPKDLLKEFDGGVAEFFGQTLPKRINTDSIYFSRGANVCMGAARTCGLSTTEERDAYRQLVAAMKSTRAS